MEDGFRFTDSLGPNKIAHIYEPTHGLRAVVVINNVACGPAIGGIRLAPDVTTEEAFRLARAMTFKNAAAGLPHGGGKSVIIGNPKMPLPQKEQLIRAFACAIRDLTEYIPGPDMGTDERCMGWIKEEKIRANTTLVLEDARKAGISPRHAAVAFAERRVRDAMTYRRWSASSGRS